MRQVWVDADACPRSVMQFLRSNQVQLDYRLWTVSSSNHLFTDEQHITVDPDPQAVDMVIANKMQPGDIVVTQDWGLAALVLCKGGQAIAPSGMIYSRERLPFMLEQRNLLARYRRGGGRSKGPAARTRADDQRFQQAFVLLLSKPEGSR